MSVSTVAARLATIQATIADVTRAFDLDEIPNTIRNAHLPCFINMPGPAEHEIQSGGFSYVTRDWQMFLYIEPAQTPVKFAVRAGRASPFLERVKTKFMGAMQLGSLAGVELAVLVDDTGIAPLEYGDTIYTGVRFTLRVTEREDTATGA